MKPTPRHLLQDLHTGHKQSSSRSSSKDSDKGSRDKAWNIAREEIKAYRKQVCQLTNKRKVKDVLELFMGR